LVAAAKFLVAATKKLIVPNFVAVTKPFFSVGRGREEQSNPPKMRKQFCIYLSPPGTVDTFTVLSISIVCHNMRWFE